MNPSDPQGELLQGQAAPDPMSGIFALQQQVQDLRSLFTATFVALIVLVLGLDLFVAKQWLVAKRQLDQTRPQIATMAVQYRQVREPNMRSFLAQLQAYATEHRDFQPYLDKYRLTLPQYLGAPVPAMPGPLKPSPEAKPRPQSIKK